MNLPGAVELAATVVQSLPAGGVSMRVMVVSAVNAGPPVSVDLAQTFGGETVLSGVRYSAAYHVLGPAEGDVVVVLVSQPGGSGRSGGRRHGGAAFVIDKIAV